MKKKKSKDWVEWDNKLTAFGIRHRSGGTTSYVVHYWQMTWNTPKSTKYTLKQKKVTIGRPEFMSVKVARKIAEEILLKNALAKNTFKVPVYL